MYFHCISCIDKCICNGPSPFDCAEATAILCGTAKAQPTIQTRNLSTSLEPLGSISTDHLFHSVCRGTSHLHPPQRLPGGAHEERRRGTFGCQAVLKGPTKPHKSGAGVPPQI